MSLHPEERSETTLYRYGRWIHKKNGTRWLWLFPGSYISKEDAVKARDDTLREMKDYPILQNIQYDIYREITVRTLTKEEE